MYLYIKSEFSCAELFVLLLSIAIKKKKTISFINHLGLTLFQKYYTVLPYVLHDS